jgi:hypothetical protein
LSQEKLDEYTPAEVTIEVNLPPGKITIKGVSSGVDDRERFSKPLQTAVNALISCGDLIKKATTELLSVEPRKKEARRTELAAVKREIPEDEFKLPAKGKVGILEFAEDAVKFPVKATRELDIQEAIGLLLYEVDKPMSARTITKYVNAFKKVKYSAVRSYLTGKRRKLQKFVIKKREGYKLTTEGEQWVKDHVIPKVKGEPHVNNEPNRGKSS